MDRLIRRYRVFKKLIDKGYTDQIDQEDFKKSVHTLNKDKMEIEKDRLENKLIEDIHEFINL